MEYIQFNESGSLLITSSCEGFTLNIWKLENHFEKKALPLTCIYKLKRGKTPARIENVTFSSDSRWICVLSNHGTAHLYYIDPFNVEEMYKRNEIMKQYNDIPISNVNISNFKNIRSKSINDMVNSNLIAAPVTKIPSPLSSPTTESPPNASNKSLNEGINSSSEFIPSSSSSLNINSIKQSNYPIISHSYHSTFSDNDINNLNNLSSSFKSNSYSSSYRSSYMNYINPSNNRMGGNNSGKIIQSYALSRIKYKKCNFYYVDSNQASHALTMNMNYKLGSDSKLIHSSNSTTTMTMNNSNNSLNSLENSENIHPILYSPYSCGKFLNKVMISNERKEPNEKQKIIIFRITDDNHQGQLELYKFFGNEADDTSINLETSPTSVSNLNNNISPRKKSFSYSPSNSISKLYNNFFFFFPM